MSAAHTPGRLTVAEPYNTDWAIMGAPPPGWESEKYAVAVGIRNGEDARRLVACWNACEGIPTESLQAHGVACFQDVVQLVDDRQVLLAALQGIIKTLSDQDDEGLIEHADEMIAARTAIAQATGGEA